MYSMDRINERMVISGIASIVMVAGCFALVPRYGGEGAAFVRLAAFTVMCGLMVRSMEFDGSTRGIFVTVLKVGAASAFCALAAGGLVHLLPGIPGLVVGIVAGALVYGVALRLLGAVPAQDIAIMEQIASRLPRRAGSIAVHALALLAPRGA
jgi:O-antigen/teichoic acid export membrane protein